MAGELAASIGANFSDYQGNAGLGGFGLGFGKIDTRPLEDLAKYTMLYNREEWDRKQKEQEKAAAELAKFAGLNLATTIPKDAKILQDKFDKTIQYIRENPDALSYSKDKNKWLEYNKMKADLENDIRFGATRSLLNVARKEAIAAEPNEQKKAFLEAQLQKNIDDTDIRTPLNHDQKYDVKPLDFGTNNGVVVDVTKAGSNEIFQRDFKLFDIQEAKRAAANAALTGVRDPKSITGQLGTLDDRENPWIQMSGRLNQAIAGAVDPQTGVVDVTKLDGVPGIENIKAYNEYVNRVKSDINAGLYKDKLGNKITFGAGPFRADDYTEVNLNDGIDAKELGVVAQFSKWAGDQYETKVIQTNDENERARLAAEWARIGIEKERMNKSKTSDLIGATSALREAADVLNSGTPIQLKSSSGGIITRNKKGEIIGDTSKITTRDVNKISDPNLLKEFGTIDKDGKTTNVPDDVFYDKEANKLQLVYYKRGADPNDVSGNATAIMQGKDGPVLDRTIDLSATQWLGQIVRRKNPNADIGGVNSLIEEFFNSKAVGRKLDNLKLIYGQTAEGTGKTEESNSSSSSKPTGTPVAGGKKRVYKGLDKNGDPIFVEEKNK